MMYENRVYKSGEGFLCIINIDNKFGVTEFVGVDPITEMECEVDGMFDFIFRRSKPFEIFIKFK